MAKRYGLIKYNVASPYIDDRGVVRLFNANFVAPPDFSAANITALATISGGVQRLPTDPGTICPDDGVQPRKLVFLRSNGNSVSIPVSPRANLIGTAIAARNIINSVAAANPVVCIKLLGEYFPNLIDELVSPGKVVGVGVGAALPANGKQNFFTGIMEYLSDAIYGGSYFLPFKVATEGADNTIAPSLYAAQLSLANVADTGANNCPGSNPRVPRRYISQAIVAPVAGAGSVSQITEIPVALHLPLDVLAVGQSIANLGAVQCVSYYGEFNDRFHKLLP